MQVLVADDSEVTRRLLGSKVRDWGYEAVIVRDGEEAWWALSQPQAPRLAILDWRMPGADGIEICRRLRSGEGLRYVFAILMTSCDLPASAVEGLRAGADDFVRKPFDLAELEQRLRTGRRIVELQDRLLAAQELLRIQAANDSLTNVWTRGEILRRLDVEWDRKQRQQTDVSVLMVDVDHFKRVNDRYGHLAGDEVLRAIAGTLANSTRSYDQVGRYGGEEFLVVLPGADLKNALTIAERIRMHIERLTIAFGSAALKLSISIGAASSSESLSSVAELIHRADQALYLAKRAGRNRVRSVPAGLLERSATLATDAVAIATP
jgi:diguanylate cyclase (GGDEF)-like protein